MAAGLNNGPIGDGYITADENAIGLLLACTVMSLKLNYHT